MARTVRAYVGLGANVGDARATLAAAVATLEAVPEVRVRGVSRLFRTRPVGVEHQPDFLNAVAALDVRLDDTPASSALRLLATLKAIERDAGRVARERWGPRELDLDLLVFGRHRIAVDRPPTARSIDADADPERARRRLDVPHPAAPERLFVLAPLADLAPGLVPPGWGETVETVRRRRTRLEGPAAVRPVARWDDGAGRWVALEASVD